MPSQVCLQCVHYINQAFSFKQLCERSDATLKQILATSTFMELKPVNPNEFIVSDVDIEQHIDGFNRNETKEEKVDETNEIDNFFDSKSLFYGCSKCLNVCVQEMIRRIVIVMHKQQQQMRGRKKL